jgi:uncharacterized membrane protein (DUF373 family)
MIDFKKILAFYSAIIAIVIAIGGLNSSASPIAVVQNFLFLFVVVFLWYIAVKFKNNRLDYKNNNSKIFLIILIISVILTTIMTIGGFITSKSLGEFIANIFFLPIAVELLIISKSRIKITKKHLQV